jgi:hypothetical protein
MAPLKPEMTDVDRMIIEDLPGRVFLDTCIINFILDHCEEICDGVSSASCTDVRSSADIDAPYNIFLTGQRAMWQVVVSP